MNIFKKVIYKALYTAKYIQLYRSWKTYGFDKWHVGNNIYNRPYKFQVAKVLSGLKLNSIIEVGCGFGEILVHTKANTKIGYDIDSKVIEAAGKIYKNVEFKVGGLDNIEEDYFDCLLLFNWIHNISESDLEKSLQQYYGKVNYLVLDQVQKGSKGYLYYHTYDFLRTNFKLIEKVNAKEDVRNILIYESLS